MKKICCILIVLAMLMGLSACRWINNPGNGESTSFSNSEMAAKQMEVINTFGRTQTDDRIVAYQGENEYLKYGIVYYKDGVRTEEYTHYLVFGDAAYARMKEQYADVPEVLIEDETHHIRFRSAEAVGSNYAEDLKIIQENYDLR